MEIVQIIAQYVAYVSIAYLIIGGVISVFKKSSDNRTLDTILGINYSLATIAAFSLVTSVIIILFTSFFI